MTVDPEPMLSRAQRQYVSHVAYRLRVLPRPLREELLDSLRYNLAERGQSAGCACDSSRDSRDGASAGTANYSWLDELAGIQRALGTPAAYAATLMDEAELADPGLMARSRRRHRRRVFLAALLTVTVVGGAVGAGAWWMTWYPGIGAPMGRVCVASDDQTNCSRAGVTDLSPANMLQVSCVADRKLFITVGLSADSAVSVTSASLGGRVGVGNARPDSLGPFADQMFRIDAIEPWVRPTMQDYPAPSRWPITIGPDGMLPEVHFTLTMCPTDSRYPRPDPGGSTILSAFELRYRALGYDRIATVDFAQPIAITVPR